MSKRLGVVYDLTTWLFLLYECGYRAPANRPHAIDWAKNAKSFDRASMPGQGNNLPMKTIFDTAAVTCQALNSDLHHNGSILGTGMRDLSMVQYKDKWRVGDNR